MFIAFVGVREAVDRAVAAAQDQSAAGQQHQRCEQGAEDGGGLLRPAAVAADGHSACLD